MVMFNKEQWIDYGQENVSYLIGKRQHFVREDRTEIEKIIEAINNSTNEDFSSFLNNSDSWWKYYHLSEMRTSLLNWYEFEEDSELLEIGGDFGALTGIFCDRCKRVTVTEDKLYRAKAICRRYQNRNNLEVYAGRIQNIGKESWFDKFDYIVLTGQLERQGDGWSDKIPYIKYLKLINKFLKPGGKILLTVDNRYGIRNFCGARNWHTGKPFDGINRYPLGTQGYEFQKQELKDIFRGAEINNYKFFYPLPDYRFPQLIYSDDYQNSANIAERLEFYDFDQTTLIAAERNLYEDIVNNGMLPFMSNSFLVEICSEDRLSDISYAVVSADRGRKYGLSTTIHNSKYVRKKAAFPSGRMQIKRIKKNIDCLEKQGIAVIPHYFNNDIITMPYVEEPTLSSALKILVVTNKEQFISLIDRLYSEILKSSQIIEGKFNEFLTEDNKDIDFGSILSKAYLDMVPVNCFMINNELVFFDQEFVMDNCPSRFVLFRALKYTYMSMWNMEELLPISFFKEKYGFSEALWEIFESVESKFIKNIRNHETYGQFIKWKNIDEFAIRQNSDLLELPSDILRYHINENTDAIRNVELQLLKKLQSVCEKYNLQYFGFYGTLIGTVRHNGFIPWDDDIDIVLFREDYDRLLEIADKEFQEPYFLQTMFSDPECFYGGYSKLRNCNTTALDIKQWHQKCNKGICIDIFPLDYCYKEPKKNKYIRNKIQFCQKIIYAKLYDLSVYNFGIDEKYWEKLTKISNQFTLSYLYNKLNALFRGCPQDNGEVAILAKMNFSDYLPTYSKTYFENVIQMNFESLHMAVPGDYQKCLSRSENNYEKYPPEELRTPKHNNCFYDVNIPYSEYEKRFFIKEIVGNLDGDIILVGSGEVAEDYLFYNNMRFPPLFIVDTEEERWGQYQYGYLIKPMEAIDENYSNNMFIITHKNFKNYERILWSKGIYNYKIFLHSEVWALYSAQ